MVYYTLPVTDPGIVLNVFSSISAAASFTGLWQYSEGQIFKQWSSENSKVLIKLCLSLPIFVVMTNICSCDWRVCPWNMVISFGTAATLQLFGAVGVAKLQTIVCHSTIRVKHGDFRHMNLWMKSTSVCSFCHTWWQNLTYIMAQVDDMS